MIAYKKIYDKEELEELISWTKKNLDRVPASLQLDAATYIPNLRQTLETYIEICEKLHNNETYGAQIRHLFLMREKIENDNLLLPEE